LPNAVGHGRWHPAGGSSEVVGPRYSGLIEIMALCKYNRTHAAAFLGISIRCLRLKLHEYNFSDLVHEPPPPRLSNYCDG
jgi:hypothetical protein